MGLTFPYTYVSCPCSDRSGSEDSISQPAALFQRQSPSEELPEEDEAPFDPRHPRSNFSLFPPEHLLYCEECHDLKCPRCIIEEQVSYFCTSCLFETPSSAVRSEGIRCARNCFNCPICFSQLSVNSVDGAVKDGPWILNCNYCMWTSMDIGIKFDRPTNIRAQLDKIVNGGKPKASFKPPDATDPSRRSSYLSREPFPRISTTAEDIPATDQEVPTEAPTEAPLDPAARFIALKAFYKNQLTTTTAVDPTNPSISGEFSYSSPASLARIMNLYSTSGGFKPKKKPKTPFMREALHPSEGILLPTAPTSSYPTSTGFSDTVSLSQRHFQTSPGGGNPHARSVSDLRPMPAPLTAKRAKRCKECRHILVKPEAKPTSTRYRINLIALNYIPQISCKPLPGATTLPNSSGPAGILGGDVVIEPGRASQWVLTLKNPLFDSVRVSLATPAVMAGRWGHRVTVLCPQFEVGANSDVWDEALNAAKSGGGGGRGQTSGGVGVAEAGKVYEKGRNWTSVVLEIIPAPVVMGSRARQGEEEKSAEGEQGWQEEQDEDVLEIPIRVRLEWKQADLDEGANKKAKLNEAEEGMRELACWMVLGVGRVKT